MFTYSDGSVIKVGDSVLFEQGKCSGSIETIIETADELSQINLADPGVMIKSNEYGLIYLTEWHLANEPIALVSRAPSI